MLVLFMVLSLGLFQIQDENESVVFWSSNEKIEWSDFQSKPDSLQTFGGNLAKAASATGIDFFKVDSAKHNCFNLKSIFYCADSWKIEQDKILLEHERLHFDIRELQARKLRKRLLELSELCEGEIDLDSELDDSFEIGRSINTAYDNETLFGTNYHEQERWSNKVKAQLDSLSEYSDEKVICFCD